MARDVEARAVTIVDIPLVMRLTEHGTVLDSELGYTRDVQGPNGTLLSLLPQRGLHTFIAKEDKQSVVGQFRVKSDDPNAQLIYLAPAMKEDDDDTAWLHILDAMAREAGKHHVHNLIAEVDENTQLFKTLRTSGFAVYARQEIWRRNTGHYPEDNAEPILLEEQTDADLMGIQSLFINTVPSLVQQIAMPTSDSTGLIYRKGEHVEAYIGISEGKYGIFLIPLIHPDSSREARDIIKSAIKHHTRAEKLPIHVCVWRHQEWLDASLIALGFEGGIKKAVMVRHIAAGIRHAQFKPVEESLRTAPIKPPTRPLRQSVIKSTQTHHLVEK